MVQGKGEGQAQQLGPLRQGNLRQVVQRSSQLQAHHPRRCVGKAEDPWLSGQERPPGAARQRYTPASSSGRCAGPFGMSRKSSKVDVDSLNLLDYLLISPILSGKRNREGHGCWN